jgi:hypothetical protein
MDDTTVANLALSAIGTRSTIASLSEDSTEAATCQLWYAQTRDSLLRKLPWNWARRQVAMAVYKAAIGTPENPTGILDEPPLPWKYSYAWPADCLSARYILPLGPNSGAEPSPPLTSANNGVPYPTRTPPIKFLVAGDRDTGNNPLKVILTNKALAVLVYTGKVNDPNIWDQNFVDAMVGRLAARISFALSGDKTLTKMAIALGLQAEADAEAQNGDEGISVNMWDPQWLVARGDYEDASGDGDQTYLGGGPQDIT